MPDLFKGEDVGNRLRQVVKVTVLLCGVQSAYRPCWEAGRWLERAVTGEGTLPHWEGQ